MSTNYPGSTSDIMIMHDSIMEHIEWLKKLDYGEHFDDT